MTTSTYFPQQLLRQSIEERVTYFEKKIIAHPKLSDLYQEILESINHPVDISLLMIYGPTGVGKTTLRQRLQRELMAAAQAEPDRDPGHIPVVGLEVALSENRFNWPDYYRRALKALNEPLIGDKIEYGQRGIEYNAAGELIFVSTISAPNLRDALEQALNHRRPKAFFVDEAQHFNTTPKNGIFSHKSNYRIGVKWAKKPTRRMQLLGLWAVFRAKIKFSKSRGESRKIGREIIFAMNGC